MEKKKKIVRRSENARAVAFDVIGQVRKGLKVNLGETIVKHGYKESVSKKPKKITEQLAYKEVMAPMIAQLESERQRTMTSMSKRNLDNVSLVDYTDLVRSMDILTKNIQLLGGKPTEIVEELAPIDKARLDKILGIK